MSHNVFSLQKGLRNKAGDMVQSADDASKAAGAAAVVSVGRLTSWLLRHWPPL